MKRRVPRTVQGCREWTNRCWRAYESGEGSLKTDRHMKPKRTRDEEGPPCAEPVLCIIVLGCVKAAQTRKVPCESTPSAFVSEKIWHGMDLHVLQLAEEKRHSS